MKCVEHCEVSGSNLSIDEKLGDFFPFFKVVVDRVRRRHVFDYISRDALKLAWTLVRKRELCVELVDDLEIVVKCIDLFSE